jgi:Arc/MetJ family transcription regulator
MGWQIKRDRGLRLACEQFIEVFSEKHRQVSIEKRLSSQPRRGRSFLPGPQRHASGAVVLRDPQISLCVSRQRILHKGTAVRTNIEIDDQLIREALRVSGLKTKRAAVDAGLRALIRLNRQKKILDLAGKVHWEGNLAESREGRFSP